LLDYIEESTDFRRADFRGKDGPGTFLTYTMRDAGDRYTLEHLETICGPTRPSRIEAEPYMTDMVGAGYVPPLAALEMMLLIRPRTRVATNWRDLTW
jgi:hypothetical protein